MDGSGQKNSINTNIFTEKFGFSPVNPFSAKNMVSFTQNPQKHLNGYDSTILNNSKFDGAEEQELSIDYRIKEKEQAIKNLEEKIKLADNYGTQNESLGLKAKHQRYLDELSNLEKQRAYSGRVLGDKEKILHETLKEKMPFIYKVQSFVSRNILAKISKKVNSVVTLSDSLEQLSQISKSVDELMDMNIPYGEKGKNYDKLTQYLNKANTIHSKISKTLRY